MFRKVILFSLACLLVLTLAPPVEGAIGSCVQKAHFDNLQTCQEIGGSEHCYYQYVCSVSVCGQSSCTGFITVRQMQSDLVLSPWSDPDWQEFKLACEGHSNDLGEGWCGNPFHQPDEFEEYSRDWLRSAIYCCSNKHALDCELPGNICSHQCG